MKFSLFHYYLTVRNLQSGIHTQQSHDRQMNKQESISSGQFLHGKNILKENLFGNIIIALLYFSKCTHKNSSEQQNEQEGRKPPSV